MNRKPKYLYIVSSPHGGSTLLSLVLGKHPLATNLGEASFIPKLLALHELCTCGVELAACPDWAPVFLQLAERAGCDLRSNPYGLFLGDALKAKEGSGLIDHSYQSRTRFIWGKARGALDTASLLATPAWLGLKALTLPSVRTSIRNTLSLYAAAAEVHNSELIIDASKLPRKAPHLYQQLPEQVRILHLVRDGRGVVASRKKYMPVDRAAERWNHYHSLTQRILQRWVKPEHRMRLRYEDFVADPQGRLSELWEWLDMQPSAECLQFDAGVIEHSAGGNPARFALKDGIKPADERWRSVLNHAEMASFNRSAGALNRDFGYE